MSIAKQKDRKSSHKSNNEGSFSDSEMKFSENFSHGEFSNRHERRSSGNYLKTDYRNYVKDIHQYSFNSNDDHNKVKDKLNISKESEMLGERMSRLEILQDKNLSNKGPIMAKSEKFKMLSSEDLNEGRKSESLKLNPNLDNYVEKVNDEPFEDNNLKELLKEKVKEAQKLNEKNKYDYEIEPFKDIEEAHQRNFDNDDLIAFPSDDENSKKLKEQAINDINSVESESNKQSDVDHDSVLFDYDNKDKSNPFIGELKSVQEVEPSKNVIAEVSSEKKSDLGGESNKSPKHSNFPNINDSKSLPQNYDLMDDIVENRSVPFDEIDDEQLDILRNSNFILNHEILLESSKTNIVKSARIESKYKLHTGEVDPTTFTDEDHKINKSQTSDVLEVDKVPEKPFTLDIEGIPKIEHVPESDDLIDKKAVAELIFEGIKEPSPSISDIFNDDLTGNSTKSEAKTKRKARTEDDLPGGNKVISKQDKSEAITEELLFYLISECRNNLFPQRVNPEKLKIKTEEEIERFEQQKAAKEQESLQMSDAKSIKELRESIEYESPQNRMAIKTETETIMSYMKGLFQKVDNSEDEFIMNLSSPLQRNPLEILMHLQNTQYDLESSEQLPYQPSVLTVDIYLEIERGRKRIEETQLLEKQKLEKEDHEREKLEQQDTQQDFENKSDSKPSQVKPNNDYDDSDDSDNRSEFTKEQELNVRLFNLKCEWENIHNKVIFDAVNEALDGLRPYGLKGPPLPWSKQNRTLTYKNGDVSNIPKILEQVEGRVMGWAKTFAGTLNFSELLREYKIPYLDDDQLAQVREERLALLLATEIEENEPMWTDYEFEETQVKLELSNAILEDLLKETVELIKGESNNSEHSNVDNVEPLLNLDKDAINLNNSH